MAKYIDDLLARVTDPSLREDLQREIAGLSKQQKFGLVFEHDEPESVELPNTKIRKGSVVRFRAFTTVGKSTRHGRDERLFHVLDVNSQPDDTGTPVRMADIVSKPTLSTVEEPVELTVAVSDLVAVAEFGTPVYPGLKHTGSAVHAQSTAAKDKPSHVVIKGENFHALQALTFTHEASVDCIYIDPPYNTGGDFTYNDKRVSKEDSFRHSKWLSFMHRRLEIAKRLLKNTGVIIVAIDDNEHAHLKLLMDQIFGEQNFISNVVWQGGRKNDARYVSNGADYMLVYAKSERAMSDVKTRWREEKPGLDEIYSASKRAWTEGKVDALDEYVFDGHGNRFNAVSWREYVDNARLMPRAFNDSLMCVDMDEFFSTVLNARPEIDRDEFALHAARHATARLKQWFKSLPIGHPSLASKHFNHICERTGGSYFPDNISWPGGGGPTYEVLHAVTGQPVPVPSRGWRFASPDRMQEEIAAGRIHFGPDHTRGINRKSYLEETSHQVLESVLYQDRRGSTKNLVDVLGEKRFDFPKDTNVLARWIGLVTSQNPNAVILDFFGGSGSTLHAVMEMNAADNGSRQCLLITNNEVESKQAAMLTKAGHVPGDVEWESCGVLERVTRPRVSTVVTGIRAHLDGSAYSAGLPDERVEFFDLTHEDPGAIRLARAYKAIEPLLWLRAGAVGTYEFTNGGTSNPVAISSPYAVLHDVNFSADFINQVNADPTITHPFVVSESSATFQAIVRSLSEDRRDNAMRLYKGYTKTFETNTHQENS